MPVTSKLCWSATTIFISSSLFLLPISAIRQQTSHLHFMSCQCLLLQLVKSRNIRTTYSVDESQVHFRWLDQGGMFFMGCEKQDVLERSMMSVTLPPAETQVTTSTWQQPHTDWLVSAVGEISPCHHLTHSANTGLFFSTTQH